MKCVFVMVLITIVAAFFLVGCDNVDVFSISQRSVDIYNMVISDGPDDDGDEPHGIWDGVLLRLRELWLTLIILLVFVVAFVVVYLYRRSLGVK